MQLLRYHRCLASVYFTTYGVDRCFCWRIPVTKHAVLRLVCRRICLVHVQNPVGWANWDFHTGIEKENSTLPPSRNNSIHFTLVFCSSFKTVYSPLHNWEWLLGTAWSNGTYKIDWYHRKTYICNYSKAPTISHLFQQFSILTNIYSLHWTDIDNLTTTISKQNKLPTAEWNKESWQCFTAWILHKKEKLESINIVLLQNRCSKCSFYVF